MVFSLYKVELFENNSLLGLFLLKAKYLIINETSKKLTLAGTREALILQRQ